MRLPAVLILFLLSFEIHAHELIELCIRDHETELSLYTEGTLASTRWSFDSALDSFIREGRFLNPFKLNIHPVKRTDTVLTIFRKDSPDAVPVPYSLVLQEPASLNAIDSHAVVRPGDTIRLNLSEVPRLPYQFRWYTNGSGNIQNDVYANAWYLPTASDFAMSRLQFRVISENNVLCPAAADTVEVLLSTAGIPETSGGDILLYPDPVADFLKVEGLAAGQVSVTDLSGKVLVRFEFSGAPIDLSVLKAGLYLLHFRHGTGNLCRKFVKE